MTLLTQPELAELTALRRPDAQARWLARNGIPSLRRADGSLAVSWAAVDAVLGAPGEQARESEPDWETVG